MSATKSATQVGRSPVYHRRERQKMCGIAGYSLSARSRIDRTRAARALLAAIAERGADAAGYAYATADGEVVVHKQRAAASALLDQVAIPQEATRVILHVRDYTKGHPRVAANNHPVRHGTVVGVHNGVILNDDELMAANGFRRAEPGMTVDSEAIFALAEAYDSRAAELEALRGSMAAAWLDERRPGLLYVARGTGRPLWVGTTRREVFFASTEDALRVAERYTGIGLRRRQLAEGTLVTLSGSRAARVDPFAPDSTYVEDDLPAVRAPEEGAFCLQLLASLA